MFTISSFDVACNSGSYRPPRNKYKLNFTINTSTQKLNHLKLFWSQQTCIRLHLHLMFSMNLTTTATWLVCDYNFLPVNWKKYYCLFTNSFILQCYSLFLDVIFKTKYYCREIDIKERPKHN
jgi:hypothetical protein